MKIGILGGTFDPVHLGHLIMADQVLDILNLDKVIFIPTGRPPHKDEKNVTSSKDRMEMVNLAIRSNALFESSDIEIKENKLSYTVDTIKKLEKIYPEDELYFIVGGDSLLSLDSWKGHEEIIASISIAVVNRITANDQKIKNKISYYNKNFLGNISLVNCPVIDISSTGIRRRVKESRTINYLVPEEVKKYISDENLYK